ncbi:transcription factor bHLH122-like [Neltuma alba]|uniref:transcription factor bHLH122 n=1 Tax=Neltuma alba TaxID=207710 RepID=UPI0010A5A12A|nr:transcription factor bHLH122-like [Prosopis alba]XP_028808719.1 transcription factor bHLH122-like [Prosopis alba]
MESDLQPHPPMFRDQQQINSGLTRYRSAPTSYFTDIIDKECFEHIFNRPSSPETERVFSRLISSFSEDPPAQNLAPLTVKQEDDQNQLPQAQAQAMPSINNEPTVLRRQQSNMNIYDSAPRNPYTRSARPPLPNQSLPSAHRLPPMKTRLGNSTSNLTRHNSSPPGLLANFNIGPGYAAAVRGMETFVAADNATEATSFPSAGTLKNRPPYSSGLMSSIAEIGDKNYTELDNPRKEAFTESQGGDFMSGFLEDPWDASAIMSDNISGHKRYRDDENDAKPFSGLSAAEAKNERGSQGTCPPPLTHHLSLPKTAMEMAAVEKLLQYSDTVPCKIRAKRGCATHPRSIAERVRRTKISERMRKLQDLVPNMDKQTNTADMLDLAVDHIKDLQKQIQKLLDSRSGCTCLQRQHQ